MTQPIFVPYDFTTLSPEDFEHLVADLFSTEWGAPLEVFKPGRDGGVDLFHSRVLPGQLKTIIQCKRYAPHKVSELSRSVKQEHSKLQSLKPERYVLATSVQLSPANKQSLAHLLHPFLKDSGDIYSAADLNLMLRRHPAVERTHFKLWISSTTVLERVLHAGIFNVTESTIEVIKSQMARLVVHDGYDRARAILEENHHCVIAGNPGIGKTTLARMLMCEYLQAGFTPIIVIGDISDAWSTITRASTGEEKYIVLYDDFLGTFRFDESKFSKNEDASLLRFVERARKSDHLRFILTTREYIMEDARRLHGTFAQQADKLAKCTILLTDYARASRARVLFNHLYFSDLPETRLTAIVETGIYRELVSHAHFNPRVIESISTHANSASLADEAFIDYLRQEFDDPSSLWRHPFENQISRTARELLAVLWSLGGTAELEVLKQALLAFKSGSDSPTGALEYSQTMRELTGNFVISTRHEHSRKRGSFVHVVRFQNPSVEEFVDRLICREPAWQEAVATHAAYFVQIDSLTKWAEESRTKIEGTLELRERFWKHLHTNGARVEDRHAGRLFRLGGMSNSAYTDQDGIRPIDRTLILLRIARHVGRIDARTRALKHRVETIDGWTALLTDAPWHSPVASSALQIVELSSDRSNNSIDRARLQQAFERATRHMLQQHETWPAGLKSLENLAEALRRRPRGVPDAHATVIRTIALQTAADMLDHDENIDLLEDSARALEQMRWLLGPECQSLVSDLYTRADNIVSRRSKPTRADQDTLHFGSRRRHLDDFDIDEMFVTLPDR